MCTTSPLFQNSISHPLVLSSKKRKLHHLSNLLSHSLNYYLNKGCFYRTTNLLNLNEVEEMSNVFQGIESYKNTEQLLYIFAATLSRLVYKGSQK